MPDTRNIQLIPELARQVERGVLSRGESYFRSGAVEGIQGEDLWVEATVLGTLPYRVSLEFDPLDGLLLGTCSCPYFEDRDEICKHIWALILHVDRAGLMPGWRNSKEAESTLLASGAGEMGIAPGRDVEDFVLRTLLSLDPDPLQRRRSLGSSSPSRSDWRLALGSLNRSHLPPPPAPHLDHDDRELLYLLELTDAPRSIAVQVCRRERKASGEWGKLKPWGVGMREAACVPDPRDREILGLLLGAEDSHLDYYFRRPDSTFSLPPTAEALLVERMCRTGRCALGFGTREDADERLRWDEGGPWQMRLHIEQVAGGKEVRLSGRLVRDGEYRSLDSPALRLGNAVAIFGDLATSMQIPDPAWLDLFARVGSLEIPAGEREAFLEHLFRLPVAPPIDLPESLELERVQVDPVPRFLIEGPQEGSARPSSRLNAALSFAYDGKFVKLDQPRGELYDRENHRLLARNAEAERSAVARLRELGVQRLKQPRDSDAPFSVAAGKLGAIVRPLVSEGWHVVAEGRRYRSAGIFQLQVTSGIDWFELEGSLQFDDASVPLPELLKAAAAGERTIRLGDGDVGILPEQWLAQYGVLAAMAGKGGRRLRFGLAQVTFLDALLAGLPEVSYDDRFTSARDRLALANGIAPAAAPASFQGKLREYQEEGLGWLRFLHDSQLGGCLADDMGLGKTIQMLALLEWQRARRKQNGPRLPSLAVVPRSVLWNWEQEAQRFTPKLRVRIHAGADREVDFANSDLVLTTYGTLLRDILKIQEIPFDCVVLDEAQAIKNAGSARAKAVRLLKARGRFALSGTPVENHLGELWSLFEFLNPGMLGSSAGFRRLLGGNGKKQEPDDAAVSMVARAVRPFMLRRTKSQVASELPPRTEQTIYCELKGGQRRRYNELRRYYQQSLKEKMASVGFERSKIQVLEALLRLRQAACHLALIDEAYRDEPGAKLEALLPQLREIIDGKHKALVFSQFTRFLAILRDHLDREKIPYEYLDGRTRKRGEKVQRFEENPDCPLFLISLKAGGLGLNLTSASYVYLLDPWWNPAVEAQAIDRAHRIGQTRQVFAYRVIARDTVEERILELQDRKRDLAASIITADNSLLRKLRPEDLELLLS